MVPKNRNYFDERVARRYDARYAHQFDPAFIEPAADFLVERAGSGPVLELGIGTGRLALPLSARGIRVYGVDLSPPRCSPRPHHWWFVDGDVETFSAPFRYVWPAELDPMARMAGMTLSERWADWDRSPFTHESTGHVSVWKKGD